MSNWFGELVINQRMLDELKSRFLESPPRPIRFGRTAQQMELIFRLVELVQLDYSTCDLVEARLNMFLLPEKRVQANRHFCTL